VAQALPLARESETRYDAAWQIGELERRVAELLPEQARLQTALRRAQSTPAESTTTLPAAAAELEQELQAAYLRIADLEAASIAPVRLPPTSPPSRLHTELSDLLFALRPDVVLLRDTLRTITIEFASRAVAYQAMGELPLTGGRPEGGKWKALQRVDRWWERHLLDGRSDGARAYARFDAVNRQWQLLIGWKTEQTRDIDWLARQ